MASPAPSVHGVEWDPNVTGETRTCCGLGAPPGTPWSGRHLVTRPGPDPGGAGTLPSLWKRQPLTVTEVLRGPGASLSRRLPYWTGLVGKPLSSQGLLCQTRRFHPG